MQWIIRALAIWIALASVGARADQAASCGSPPDLHDGWSVAAPEREDLDPALICGIGPRLDGWEEANPHAVVVARHGALVYEHYFAGKDWRLTMPLGVVTFDAGAKSPNRLKFTTDGKRVLISEIFGGGLIVLDAENGSLVKRLPLGRGASGILVTPDGLHAYVALTGDNSVAVINLATLTEETRLNTGSGPDGMAWLRARP